MEQAKKKIWPSLQRIIELFTRKILLSSQKYGLRSGIRDPEKNYSGSRGPKGPRSRIRNTGFRALQYSQEMASRSLLNKCIPVP
jgi:hypothetical protein